MSTAPTPTPDLTDARQKIREAAAAVSAALVPAVTGGNAWKWEAGANAVLLLQRADARLEAFEAGGGVNDVQNVRLV